MLCDTTIERAPTEAEFLGQVTDAESGKVNVFQAAVTVSLARGHAKLNQLVESGACFHEVLDERYQWWVNPHNTPAKFKAEGQMCGEVEPFTMWINYNGFLWGLCQPFHDVHVEHPHPDGANARSFALACHRAIEAAAMRDSLKAG